MCQYDAIEKRNGRDFLFFFRLYSLNEVFTFLLSYCQELVHYVVEEQRYSSLFKRYTLVHGSILVTLFRSSSSS